MIGFCIGVGEGWDKCAQWACKRMVQMTGIECIPIHHLSKSWTTPSWGKLEIATHIHKHANGHNIYMIFDADILPMKPWRPRELFINQGRKFLAARDVDSIVVMDECKRYDIPMGEYYNAGLMIFGSEHLHVFDTAATRHPTYGRWQEQTAINKALQDTNTNVIPLPRAYNTLLWPDKDSYKPNDLINQHAVNLHCASLGGNWKLLKSIQSNLPA